MAGMVMKLVLQAATNIEERQKNLLKQLKKVLQRAELMELLKVQFDTKRMENILILRQMVLLYHLGSNRFGGDYRWD